MYRKVLFFWRTWAAGLLLLQAANATVVPQFSFEQLTDSSEMIATGTVARSWSAWDSAHKYIWTHYELTVTAAHKGAAVVKLEFAEPGGSLDGAVVNVAGSVGYAPGDHVTVFLERMPNGYLRTTGWEQGKYMMDSAGRLHAPVMKGGDSVVAVSDKAAATSLRSLEGMTLRDFGQMVAARVRASQGQGGGK